MNQCHSCQFNNPRGIILSQKKILCEDITIDEPTKINEEIDTNKYQEIQNKSAIESGGVQCNDALENKTEQLKHKEEEQANSKTEKDLKEHKVSNHEASLILNEVFKCRKCEYKAKDIANIDKHMESTHGKNKLCSTPSEDVEELTCRHCDFEAASGEDMRRHKVAKHTSFKCMKCEFTTLLESEFSDHIKSTQIDVSVELNKIELPVEENALNVVINVD